MARLVHLLCLSFLATTLVLCMRSVKKNVLVNIGLEGASKAKAAEAGNSAGATTWPLDQGVVERAVAAKEDAKLTDEARASGSQQGLLAKWLGAFIADMPTVAETWSLGGGGALIIAEKPVASKQEAKLAQPAKVAAVAEPADVAAASEEAGKTWGLAEAIGNGMRLQVFPHGR